MSVCEREKDISSGIRRGQIAISIIIPLSANNNGHLGHLIEGCNFNLMGKI